MWEKGFDLFGNVPLQISHSMPWHCWAWQNSLPQKIIWRWSLFHEDFGKIFFRSLSVSVTFFPLVKPHLWANRWMWVSIGKAGYPNPWEITTPAVLWPTPGSSSSSSNVLGTFPLCFLINCLDKKNMLLALTLKRPILFINFSIFFLPNFIKCSGLLYFG